MTTPRFDSLLAVLLLLCAATAYSDDVSGRYVVYGNPLSPALALGEFEVWSGGANVVAGKPEMFSQDYLYRPYRGSVRDLVDGKKDTVERHAEFGAAGLSHYSDTAMGYTAFEVDLGAAMPIEKIDIYRSRYLQKAYQDLGWRYLLVLDVDRKIVAWTTFNVYAAPHPDNKGIWSIVPTPAEGVPAGKVVPHRSRSWLSEAEFLRDFLGKPVVDQVSDLSPVDQARLARFEQRNSPEEIERLGREFFRIVELDRPGLEQVKALVEQEKYAEALEAFKAPFFETISVLAGKDSFEYSWGYDPDSRDTMRVRDLTNNIFGDKKTLTVTRFRPGLLPPAQFQYPFQMRPLLVAYSGTGDQSYLAQWQAMTDDWALSFQEAADENPALREHFVLIGSVIKRNLQDLAQAAEANPEFVNELSGATLARFLMPIAEEMPVAMWRVWRKAVFNHTFNATGGAYELSKLLADFRAGTRLEREFRQQTLRLHTLSQYRDGPMVELSDEGHFIFNYLAISKLYGQLCVDRPAWFTPEREAYMLDNLRQAELVAVRHASPNGTGLRWSWHRSSVFPTFQGRFTPENDLLAKGERIDEAALASFLERASVMHETQPRLVMDRLLGLAAVAEYTREDIRGRRVDAQIIARLHPTPSPVSDWMPYSGAYYFRGGWEREDAMLHMLKPAIASAIDSGTMNTITGAWERFNTTSYRFVDYATQLTSTFATEIDKQMPADHLGRYPSGSKQSTFTQAVEKPQPFRWYSDARLDFGEAVYSGPYHNIYRYGKSIDGVWTTWNEEDPLTIEDVTTTRQIVQVRPARLFLHIERTDFAQPDETRTLRIPSTVVLSEPGPETKATFSMDQLQIDAAAKTVKARNPGNPGVTLAWCGQPDLTFSRYSVRGVETLFWPWPRDEEVDPSQETTLQTTAWKGGFDSLNGKRATMPVGLFSTWQATGSSVVIGALYANAPGEEPVRKLEDISTDLAAGIRVTSANGVVTTLLVARRIPAQLEIGTMSATAEALMLIDEPRKQKTVMVLGATALTLDGAPMSLPAADAVFAIDSSESKQPAIADATAIRKPLDPPTIGPAVGTFTDSVMVTLSTSSPDAIIRYTTETPASRMDEFLAEARKLNAGATTLTEAAERLAIRELEGMGWQVYTGPFEVSEDTLVRARTFHKDALAVPMLRTAADDVSAISYGFFDKQEVRPAKGGLFTRTKPGLRYEYLEARWFALWTYADVLPAKSTGITESLLDVSMRETDEPFGVRYHGYIKVPKTGVYTFHAPYEFVHKVCEPGYDLRVFVDGEEWDLGQTWHGLGTWSIPLAKGLHEFRVIYADARATDVENQRKDLWSSYPEPATVWRGVAPQIDLSGPGLPRQALPDHLLRH